MGLLELAGVSKSYQRGRRRLTVLDRVTLDIDEGEVVAVWGLRRSGRSTLLRIAAGVETPDEGTVRFRGENLRARVATSVGDSVAYCRRNFAPSEGQVVFDQLLSNQEACGVPGGIAKAQARAALRQVGADRCGGARLEDLDHAERVRVALARALTLQPGILVIDDPTAGVDLCDRDAILDLLRTLAQDGIGILMSTGETPCLSGADRALTIGNGSLRGQLQPRIASVVSLIAGAQPAA